MNEATENREAWRCFSCRVIRAEPRKATSAMLSEVKPRYRVYSWSGQGNIGDDWIHEVSRQYLDVVSVREERSIWRLLGHELRGATKYEDELPLILWGGGWLASDRPGSTTLTRWSRHIMRERTPVTAFGLGVGPFNAGGRRERSRLEGVLQGIQRLSVRTSADIDAIETPNSAELACDPTILDKRFVDPQWVRNLRGLRGSGADYAIFTMPSWRPHWQESRPWLTEENYLRFAEAARDEIGLPIKHLIFDSSGKSSDESYWRHLGDEVVRPQSPEEAAAVIAGASRAICGRLHAAIMCALLGTPALVVAYHHKFDLVEELGLPTAGAKEFASSAFEWRTADQDRIHKVRQRGDRALRALIDLSRIHE